MPTTVSQKTFSASIVASGVGTLIPVPEITGAILTQSEAYIVTQSGANLIVN